MKEQKTEMERPNIVLIMADDMGFSDLGCYGGEIRTPNLDSLAEGGLRFTNFYNNALCSPTRASLLTGVYPQQGGGGSNSTKMQNCVTLADVLKTAGYHTLMSGKWHHHQDAGLPVERGFDRFYGLISGCCNYFNPGKQRPGENKPGKKMSFPEEKRMRPWAIDDKVIKPFTPKDKNFYTTDAFTDQALEYLDRYGSDDKPFFLYLPYTAPHYPLQAWPEDIEKYRGEYMGGWDELRQRRYERMVEMGIVEKQWGLSPSDSPPWDEVDNKEAWDLQMAVYAAMIDRMDQNIGRVIEKVESMGQRDNTLFLFLSDNGSTAEDFHFTPDVSPGPMESYHTVDQPWANMSNTPFRLYKFFNHEGGISTPLIASWPGCIDEDGALTHQDGHIIDIMATLLDVAGAEYPDSISGQRIVPLEGKSLLPVLQGERREGHKALYWKTGNSRAVIKGGWKLVQFGDEIASVSEEQGPWELYYRPNDRCELNDLAADRPDKVEELSRDWDIWNCRCSEERKGR